PPAVAAPRTAATAAPDSAPPRLSRDAVPASESVELTLDPEQSDYRGRVTIALDVREPARELRFHARGMTLDDVSLRGRSGEVRVASVERLVPDQARVRLAEPAPPGAYTLAIRFHNPFNTRAVSLYRVVTGGHGQGGARHGRRGGQGHARHPPLAGALLRPALSLREARSDRGARVPLRRDGERGGGGIRRPPPAHRPALGEPRAAAGAHRRDRARARAHVVRRPRHHELVGRSVAQRVVRELDGDQGD